MQYQHGAMYQGQSGSPPPTGMPRVSLPANPQTASARPTVPLAQGVPQQQQVKNGYFYLCRRLDWKWNPNMFWRFVEILSCVDCAGDHSGAGSGAGRWRTETGQLFVHARGTQSPREAAQRRQRWDAQVTPPALTRHHNPWWLPTLLMDCCGRLTFCLTVLYCYSMSTSFCADTFVWTAVLCLWLYASHCFTLFCFTFLPYLLLSPKKFIFKLQTLILILREILYFLWNRRENSTLSITSFVN